MAKAIMPVSMIINEIRSLHVTYTSTTSFPEPEKDGMTALSAALVSILCCQCSVVPSSEEGVIRPAASPIRSSGQFGL